MKYTPISISPEQAQFLETRKFQINEICLLAPGEEDEGELHELYLREVQRQQDRLFLQSDDHLRLEGFQPRHRRYHGQHHRTVYLQPLRFAVRFRHHDGRGADRPQLDPGTERDLHQRGQYRQARHRRFQLRVLAADGHYQHGVRRILQRRDHFHPEQG